MGFVVPAMPLSFKSWHNFQDGVNAYAGSDLTEVCNLSPGRRVMLPAAASVVGTLFTFPMEMLVPKLTDVRPKNNADATDLIECPKNTGRFYEVHYVDDIGKGFANEHRFVIMVGRPFGANFSDIGQVDYPIPLP